MLAGLTLSQVAKPGAPVMYGGFGSNVDMRSGAPAFGTPTHMQMTLGTGQLARLLGLTAMVVGVGCVVFAPEPITALLGFLLMGGGSAVIFPLAMSAAAQRSEKTPEENVASLAQFVFCDLPFGTTNFRIYR